MEVKYRYKIGDIVWVVKPGHTYNQYSDKFTEMGFTPTPDNNVRWSFSMYTRAEIWVTGVHQDGSPLYGIRDFSGNESLVGEKAISLVTAVKKVELTPHPDADVVFDELRPDNAHIKWHPDTKMVTLPGLRMNSIMRKKLVESPNMEKTQIVRLYNPYTDNYADYVQTGWNDTYSHFMDPVYSTHLRFDSMNN